MQVNDFFCKSIGLGFSPFLKEENEIGFSQIAFWLKPTRYFNYFPPANAGGY